MRTFVSAILLAIPLVAPGAELSGDLRAGLLITEVRDRDGILAGDDASGRLRARLRFATDAGDDWRFVGRVATILDTGQSGFDGWLRMYAPSAAGLGIGQATVDEAYVLWQPGGGRWSARAGRFQAVFALDDVMRKSLDQNDSPNFDVTWTDGLWLRHQGDDWTTHLIVRHNDASGPTGTLRPPLSFQPGGARVGAFVAVEGAPSGVLAQRLLTLTWLPDAMAGDDYLALTAKLAAEWPLGDGGMKLRVGGEAGYAPDAPAGNDGAFAWQWALGLVDVLPGHTVAVVYGELDDGWLLSGDFRPGETLFELRWIWRLATDWTASARVRRRAEADPPASASVPRRTDDFYLRLDFRF